MQASQPIPMRIRWVVLIFKVCCDCALINTVYFKRIHCLYVLEFTIVGKNRSTKIWNTGNSQMDGISLTVLIPKSYQRRPIWLYSPNKPRISYKQWYFLFFQAKVVWGAPSSWPSRSWRGTTSASSAPFARSPWWARASYREGGGNTERGNSKKQCYICYLGTANCHWTLGLHFIQNLGLLQKQNWNIKRYVCLFYHHDHPIECLRYIT